MSTLPRQALRQLYRQSRQSLSSSEQRAASLSVTRQLVQLKTVTRSKRIACYLSNDGEVDLNEFIQHCGDQGIDVYLPVLHPFLKGYLLFIQHQKNDSLNLNKYGIAEPVLDVSRVCPVTDLDVILTPLVAFDDKGNRLGMGGGFYDRTLSHTLTLPLSPVLIGIAHDCQKAPSLSNQAWDIPMHQIVTPSHVITPL